MKTSTLFLSILLLYSSASFSDSSIKDKDYYGPILKSNVLACSAGFASIKYLLESKTKNNLSFDQFQKLYHSKYNTEYGITDATLEKVYETENPIYGIRECPSRLIERIKAIEKENNNKDDYELIETFEEMDKLCSKSSDNSLSILSCYHKFADAKIKERSQDYGNDR